MDRLIQDLMDVALMEAGQLPIKRARLSAGELIVEVVDVQRPLTSSTSLALRADVDRDLPDVWGDRDRLLQVFENLIGNAIKFTKAGGDITVGAAPRNREVVFWVADTGCGIAPESLPRIFDRLWQATSASRQGAGLGLPIARGIVGAHGGRIWVESTQGRGTTFSFTIPGVEQPMSTDGHDEAAEAVSSGSVPPVSQPVRHRVLLVEDHADVAEATAEFMRLYGLEVRIAKSGREALEMAEEFNPVIILCDLGLPDMKGLDVAQALRTRRGSNDLLIAMLTAMSAEELRGFERQAKTFGVDLFLSKPLTSDTLIGLLSRLERKGSDRVAPSRPQERDTD
jgi:CheY-like chemotaxis protein